MEVNWLEVATYERGDDSLNRKIATLVDDERLCSGVVTAQNDGSLPTAAIDTHSFKSWLAIDKAGADSALHEFRLNFGAVVNQYHVARFERWLHAVKSKAQAVKIRRPQMLEYRKHLHLFLRLCGRASRYAAECRQVANLQTLRVVVVRSFTDKHCLRNIQCHCQRMNRARRRLAMVAFDRGQIPLIDASHLSEIDLRKPQLAPAGAHPIANSFH